MSATCHVFQVATAVEWEPESLSDVWENASPDEVASPRFHTVSTARGAAKALEAVKADVVADLLEQEALDQETVGKLEWATGDWQRTPSGQRSYRSHGAYFSADRNLFAVIVEQTTPLLE